MRLQLLSIVAGDISDRSSILRISLFLYDKLIVKFITLSINQTTKYDLDL